MEKAIKTSIFIFRRDFRLIDNIGFIDCYKKSENVIPIFNFTPQQIDSNKNEYKSDNCVQFMIESIKELDQQLSQNLNLLYGNPLEVLHEIIEKYNVDSIFTNTDYTPFAQKRDQDLQEFCQNLNIQLVLHDDHLLFKPYSIQTEQFKNVYTPFYLHCETIAHKIPKPVSLPSISPQKFTKLENISTLIPFETTSNFYKSNPNIPQKGGRSEALKILEKVKLKQYNNYKVTRNELFNAQGTTKLAAYIKFGCISVREMYDTFKQINIDLLKQLYWREFFYHLTLNTIERFGKSLKPQYDAIIWENNEEYLKLWKEGNTGFPIVDACMSELNNTGQLSNRGRLIVASFLVKNLDIDWRIGEKYFATKLIDYDPIVNQCSWQWVAGSGVDYKKYIRVFNPWTQSKKCDPQCEYIKKFLPNLKDVSVEHLHAWNKYHEYYNLKEIQYSEPMVNYKQSKKVVVDKFQEALNNNL